MSDAANTDVYLKLESLQPSGSFKNRGIGNYCAKKIKQGAKEFVCSSGGNAGLAASYSARKLNVPITVVLPESTPVMMREKIKAQKASVIVHGKDWYEADQYTHMLCEQKKACYVPPFDDPLIWEGNATIIDEVAKEGLMPDAVILSVGGGGLFCGVMQGIKTHHWHDTIVYAVETEGAASFAAAIKAGRIVTIDRIDTVAKSLGARAVTEEALKWTKKHTVRSKCVSDQAAVLACKRFADDHRLLVEPACGASLSLCYDGDSDLKNHKKVLVIACGGAAVSPQLLLDWEKAGGL